MAAESNTTTLEHLEAEHQELRLHLAQAERAIVLARAKVNELIRTLQEARR